MADEFCGLHPGLEQLLLVAIGRECHAQVLIGMAGCHAAARRARKEAKLQQIGFVNVHDGRRIFAHGGGDCF